MITKKTVFVLGAGASVPYGFPTGEKLREIICTDFPESFIKYKLPYISENEKKTVRYFIDQFVIPFRKSGISIDSFLSTNYTSSDNILYYGKMAIALHILESELNSRGNEELGLPGNDNLNYNRDWFSVLFNKMIEGLVSLRGYQNFYENNVTFITFNYDRLLEYLLQSSLSSTYFSVPDDIKSQVLRKIPIHHVYGELSKLQWQFENGVHRPSIVDFGQELSPVTLETCSDNIKTMYMERKSIDSQEYAAILKNAERVFFLGFGYQKENMEILGLEPGIFDVQTRIYGTAYGCSQRQIQYIKENLRIGYSIGGMQINPQQEPIIENTDCKNLLLDYLND